MKTLTRNGLAFAACCLLAVGCDSAKDTADATTGGGAAADTGGGGGASDTSGGGAADTGGGGGTDTGGGGGGGGGGKDTGGGGGGGTDTGGGGGGGTDTGGGGGTDTGGGGTDTGGGGGTSGWATSGSPPCSPNALWFDDRDNGFAACGDKNSGEGLYTTHDGGETWTSQKKLGSVRINDIRRGPDGLLYAAGQDQIGGSPVFTIDESNPEKLEVLADLYPWGDKAFTKVGQAENVAVTEDGQVFVDSLTGTTAAYTPGAGKSVETWCDGSDSSNFNPTPDFGWCELHGVGEESLADPNANAYQIRAVRAYGNKFYAVGSQINDPAKARMPSKLPGALYHFQTVQLQKDGEDGELLDMHMWSDTKIIAVGSDQSGYLPLIFICDGDCYDKAAWTQIELDDWDMSWDEAAGKAVAVQGDHIIVVGNQVPTSKGGIVVESTDGGKNWTDLTPVAAAATAKGKLGELENVELFPNGDIYIVGPGGAWTFTAE